MTLTIESAARKDAANAHAATFEHRHFATVAAIIKDLRTFMPSKAHDTMTAHFADAMARTNPRFDRRRFLAACEK